jgi:hypothetical protein
MTALSSTATYCRARGAPSRGECLRREILAQVYIQMIAGIGLLSQEPAFVGAVLQAGGSGT